MASTSLNNLRGEYCRQQAAYNHGLRYNQYKYKVIPVFSAMPGLGINMPMMVNGYNNQVKVLPDPGIL